MDIKERRLKILVALYLASGKNFDDVKVDNTFSTIFDIALNVKTRQTLNTLSKSQFIDHVSTGALEGDKFNPEILIYRLTEKGFHELSLTFPYFRFLRDKWDAKWRIVSYEIPEKKREMRDKLRRQVAGWGLGPWHRSFWITTHPVTDELIALVKGKEEEQYIQAFEADYVAGDREILIEKVWKKSALGKRYQDAFKSWHLILSKEANKLDKLKQITSIYISVLKQDPGMPEELVGKNWSGFEAFSIYKEIYKILTQ